MVIEKAKKRIKVDEKIYSLIIFNIFTTNENHLSRLADTSGFPFEYILIN
jgi:hypothetical protein